MVDVVVSSVEKNTGISFTRMAARDCKQSVSNARHMAIALLWCYTSMTYEEIGVLFNRDHSTAIHSRKKAMQLIDTDTKFAETMFDIYTSIIEQ